MEGVNLGGFMLLYLAVIVFGVVSLVALGLLIGRLIKASRIVFASGFLCATLIATLATLSFLDRQFNHDNRDTLFIVRVCAILLLAGAGQLVAALRSPRASYAAAFGCAAGAILYGIGVAMAGSDALPLRLPHGAAVCLVLAAASMAIAVLPPRRTTSPLLWMAQALLGGIAGFAVGDLFVQTRCNLLEPPGGGFTRVSVEVYVLGMRVSDETGFVNIDNGLPSVRVLTGVQAAWVYGTQAVVAAAGVMAALAIAAALVRQSTEDIRAAPGTSGARPRIHGYSSDQIKPA